MTGSAKQSIAPQEERMDCFVAEFIIGPAEGGTRWLLAMTAVSSRTLHRVGDTRPSRIIRCVGFAKNVDRIARLQVAPLKGRIGIEHEIADRERADPVKDPHRDAFHQVSVRTPMICGSLRCIARPPLRSLHCGGPGSF